MKPPKNEHEYEVIRVVSEHYYVVATSKEAAITEASQRGSPARIHVRKETAKKLK